LTNIGICKNYKIFGLAPPPPPIVAYILNGSPTFALPRFFLQDAYTKWLLAVFNPENDAWLLNCTEIDTNSTKVGVMSLCRDVLAKCPYFAPQNSYGDAPAFDCPLKCKSL
jgi:hypothetical protein